MHHLACETGGTTATTATTKGSQGGGLSTSHLPGKLAATLPTAAWRNLQDDSAPRPKILDCGVLPMQQASS
jgi:hypothetical protein